MALLIESMQCRMRICRQCCGLDHFGFSSTPVTKLSPRTFMSNMTITRRNSELEPVRLAWSHGFRRKEINRARKVVEVHRKQLLELWNEFFNG